jgi:hypothetical protein
MKKSEQLRRKTQDARDIFNLPASEVVVQDYYCTLKRTVKHPGTLFVTQNYLCFFSSLPKKVFKISLLYAICSFLSIFGQQRSMKFSHFERSNALNSKKENFEQI